MKFLPSRLQETLSPTAPKISNPKEYILKICQIIGNFLFLIGMINFRILGDKRSRNRWVYAWPTMDLCSCAWSTPPSLSLQKRGVKLYIWVWKLHIRHQCPLAHNNFTNSIKTDTNFFLYQINIEPIYILMDSEMAPCPHVFLFWVNWTRKVGFVHFSCLSQSNTIIHVSRKTCWVNWTRLD